MDEVPTENLHSDTVEFLSYVKEEFRNPECPHCGHRLTYHVAEFYGRDSVGSVSSTGTKCKYTTTETRSQFGGNSSVMRIHEKECDCTLRHDEIIFNLNREARRRSDGLDRQADETFHMSQNPPESTAIVVIEPDDSGDSKDSPDETIDEGDGFFKRNGIRFRLGPGPRPSDWSI
jgi:hypothetical protein